MTELIGAIVAAYGVVFLAELGDKTQLLALGFGAKYSLRTVVIGLALGFGVAGAIAAMIGGVVGASLPQRPVTIVGGLIFLGYAVATLLADDSPAGDETDQADRPGPAAGLQRSAVLIIATAILVGELGDKTQIATATLATQSNPIAVWGAATLGTVSAALVGALLGRRFGDIVSPATIRYGSAALFAVFGVLMLVLA